MEGHLALPKEGNFLQPVNESICGDIGLPTCDWVWWRAWLQFGLAFFACTSNIKAFGLLFFSLRLKWLNGDFLFLLISASNVIFNLQTLLYGKNTLWGLW